MIRGIIFSVAILVGGFLKAQQSCSQRLERAEDLYEQGKLLEIDALISGCLTDEGFSEAEAIRARKLLTKVAIFTDNEPKAEVEFVQLLTLDPVHILQPEDPSELKVLRSKFRTWPIYRLEFKGGLNLSMTGRPQQFSAFSTGGEEKDYPISIGFQLEADITRHIKNGIEVGTGIQYRNTSYQVKSEPEGDYDGPFTAEITNSQTMVRLPIFGRYNFNYSYLGENKITPFVFAGISADYLLSGSYSNASRTGGTSVTISGNDADLKKFDQVKNLNFSVLAGAGLKWTMKKGNFFFVEVRFDKSLGLYNNPEERYANERINADLLFVEDDIFLNFASFNLGLIKSVFKPEKLTK